MAPDGTRAALLVEGDVLLVDLDSLRVLKRRQVETGPTGFAQSAAWTNDGSALAVGTTNGWFHVLDGDTLEAVVAAPSCHQRRADATSRSAPTAPWLPPSGQRAT